MNTLTQAARLNWHRLPICWKRTTYPAWSAQGDPHRKGFTLLYIPAELRRKAY